jgi:hypothetical protein
MRHPHSITSKLGQTVANCRKLWTTLQFISSAAYAITGMERGAASFGFPVRPPRPLPVARCPLRSGVSNVGKKRSRNCCEGTRAHSARLEPTHHDPPSAPPLHAQQALSFWSFCLCSPKTPGAPPCLARNACVEGAHGSASALRCELGGGSIQPVPWRFVQVWLTNYGKRSRHQEIPTTALAYPGPNPSPRCLFILLRTASVKTS